MLPSTSACTVHRVLVSRFQEPGFLLLTLATETTMNALINNPENSLAISDYTRTLSPPRDLESQSVQRQAAAWPIPVLSSALLFALLDSLPRSRPAHQLFFSVTPEMARDTLVRYAGGYRGGHKDKGGSFTNSTQCWISSKYLRVKRHDQVVP